MLKIIAALADENVIGKDGQIPWHLPDDMKWFKDKTGRYPVVMGRKTFLSIPRQFRPLPGRENIVLSHTPENMDTAGINAINDFDYVVERSRVGDIWVIGGAGIYTMALPHTDELYLTRVHARVEGDTHFPNLDLNEWAQTFREDHRADERNQFDFTFEIYSRRMR